MPPCRSHRNTSFRFSPLSRPSTTSQSHSEADEDMDVMSQLRQDAAAATAARTAANAAAASTNAVTSIAAGEPPSPPPEGPLPPLPAHASRVPTAHLNATAAVTTTSGEAVLYRSVSPEATAAASSAVVNQAPDSPDQPQSGGPSFETQSEEPKSTYPPKFCRGSHTTLNADEHERHEFVPAAYFPAVQFDRILYWHPSMGCVLRVGGDRVEVISTLSYGEGGLMIHAGQTVSIFNTMARLVSSQTITDEEDQFMGAGDDHDDEDLGMACPSESECEYDIYGNEIEESDEDEFYRERHI